MGFVRDMHRETAKGEDLQQVVSEEAREELKKEKERGHYFREELKKLEIEKIRLHDKINKLTREYTEMEIQSSEIGVTYQTKN